MSAMDEMSPEDRARACLERATLGQRIKYMRIERMLTRRGLASVMNEPVWRIKGWENDVIDPNPERRNIVNQSIEPENITALIAMELADAAFHHRRATYWYALARQVQAHAKDTYLTEGDEHADRFRVHYGNAIGYASKPEPKWRNDPPVYEVVTRT